MGERWIQECEEYLKMVKGALETENPDRLDLVRTIQGALLAINHSVFGWLQYVNNPEVMGRFTREELDEMSSTLNGFAEGFLEYDIKVTKRGIEKGLSEQEQEEEYQPFYV